jgi:pimeloyl-ACP methyl ester carboxylesterase
MSTEFLIGGIKVYVYGLSHIPAHVQQLNAVYVLHPRGQTYRFSEQVAEIWLERHYSNSEVPLIAVTFDNRNHGERTIDAKRNNDWQEGNRSHGVDLCSGIEGSTQDTLLVVEYLPSVLPTVVETPIRNIITGVSLGGHISWRVANLLGPDKVHGIVPIISTPNLALMLVDRFYNQVLGRKLEIPEGISQVEFANSTYRALLDGPERQKLASALPTSLWETVSKVDCQLETDFRIRTFILCGRDDPLVPAAFNERWLTQRNRDRHEQIKIFIQPNTGHTLTPEMVDLAGTWLIELLSQREKL